MTRVNLLLAVVCLASIDAEAARPRRQAQEPAVPQRPALTNPSGNQQMFTAGSLWTEPSGRQLMGLDGNARQVGDLITVRIREDSTTALDASTSTTRDSASNARLGALLGAEQTILEAHPRMGGQVAVDGGTTTTFDGDGSTTRGSAVQAMLTCEIIEVLPGGNLRIWGWKQVRVNREIQYFVLEGTVRPRDIQMDNSVNSELLAQARIEITGSGVISDKQGPGIGTRVIDRLWPF
jgi:flagellar L-ring protein precursor FlgH